MDLRNLWGAASASVTPPALTDLHLPLIWSVIDQTVFMRRCLGGGGGGLQKTFWAKNKGRARNPGAPPLDSPLLTAGQGRTACNSYQLQRWVVVWHLY